jgi:hypothetical protein
MQQYATTNGAISVYIRYIRGPVIIRHISETKHSHLITSRAPACYTAEAEKAVLVSASWHDQCWVGANKKLFYPKNQMLLHNSEMFEKFDRGDTRMETLNIVVEPSPNYMDAYKAAGEAARQAVGSAMLVSWYDRCRQIQGPTEICGRNDWKCAVDYAVHHNADLRVSINTDQYEFFFAKVHGACSELSETPPLEVNAKISADELGNIQRG